MKISKLEIKLSNSDRERKSLATMVKKLEERLAISNLALEKSGNEKKNIAKELTRYKGNWESNQKLLKINQDKYTEGLRFYNKVAQQAKSVLANLPEVSAIDKLKAQITSIADDKSRLESEVVKLRVQGDFGKSKGHDKISIDKAKGNPETVYEKERDQAFADIKENLHSSITSISKLNSQFFSDLLGEYHKLDEQNLNLQTEKETLVKEYEQELVEKGEDITHLLNEIHTLRHDNDFMFNNSQGGATHSGDENESLQTGFKTPESRNKSTSEKHTSKILQTKIL
jgi:predicted  nucleic acid-binding Zn-ribbon protein